MIDPTIAIPVDGHVHVRRRFRPRRVLDASASNFSRYRPGDGHGKDIAGVLLLTEVRDSTFFSSLKAHDTTRGSLAPWSVVGTSDAEALILERGDTRVVLCAGRQIATRERLEVLALLTDQEFDDGEDLQVTMRKVYAGGGIPVVPWSFGKWWGARGRILRSAMASLRSEGRRVMLGDNGNRPAWAPRPAPFETAVELDGLVVPGSDPLPLISHEERAGSYGFLAPPTLDWTRPASALREYLLSVEGPLEMYGRRARLGRFARDQIALRVGRR